MTTTNVTHTGNEVGFERVFGAPRPLVFKAWTECERLKHWWGPAEWTLPTCTLDLRPGGVWHYCMRGPKGEESWGKSIYREIVEPERLVYDDFFSDASANVNEKMPGLLVTVTFADAGSSTNVKMHTVVESEEQLQTLMKMGMVQGTTEMLDRLEGYLRAGGSA